MRVFGEQPITSSRLLNYEVSNTLFARQLPASYLGEAAELLRRIDLIDLAPEFLGRALRHFPVAVRTLDGLHLATMDSDDWKTPA